MAAARLAPLTRRTVAAAVRGNFARRGYASRSSGGLLKIAVIGCNSKTGQSLALCLKQSPLIDELSVYDRGHLGTFPVELSHLDTKCRSNADHSGDLRFALKDAKIVAIITDRGHISEDVRTLKSVVPEICRSCPKALVALVSRSVNVLLPTTVELFKRQGHYEFNRLFGVLSQFQIRANLFAAAALRIDPEYVTVPVIGGGCLRSIVPLFSHTRPCAHFTNEEMANMMHRVRSVDERVALIQSSQEADESGALSAGFAAARFCVSLCKALRDEKGVVECAYTRSCLVPELKYVGAPLMLGPSGIQKQLGVSRLANQECSAFYEAVPQIKQAIAIGETLALGSGRSTEYCETEPPCPGISPQHHCPA